jgi:hypothetical protein
MKLTSSPKNELAEERALLVHRVEALGLLLAHLDALGGDDAQASFLQHLGDRAGQVAAGGVGLDDREGAGNRHGRVLIGLFGRNGVS